MAASVVRNIPAREIASSRATLSTFFGSIIQASIIFTKLSLAASYQKFISEFSITLLMITLHSFPAFSAICLIGYESAFQTISAQRF